MIELETGEHRSSPLTGTTHGMGAGRGAQGGPGAGKGSGPRRVLKWGLGQTLPEGAAARPPGSRSPTKSPLPVQFPESSPHPQGARSWRLLRGYEGWGGPLGRSHLGEQQVSICCEEDIFGWQVSSTLDCGPRLRGPPPRRRKDLWWKNYDPGVTWATSLSSGYGPDLGGRGLRQNSSEDLQPEPGRRRWGT